MKREIKVRVRYLNALMMPVEITRNVSGKEIRWGKLPKGSRSSIRKKRNRQHDGLSEKSESLLLSECQRRIEMWKTVFCGIMETEMSWRINNGI